MNLSILVLAWLCVVADPVTTSDTPETLLYVRTTPSGAEIQLNGKPLGSSDGLFPVHAGTYKIVVDLEGYQPKEQQIQVRDGRITRIEMTLKPGVQPREPGKSEARMSGTSDSLGKPLPAKVVEGVGWGGFCVGATRAELAKAFGPPEPNPTAGNPWVRWLSRYHVDCLFDERGGAMEIRFNRGFELPLASGIKIGSSEDEVLSAYGKPNRVVDNGQAKMFQWSDRGVLLWLMEGKVFDFTVFKPNGSGHIAPKK